MQTNEDSLCLDNIIATQEFLAELDNGVPIVKISQADITKIEAKKALTAERPIVQFISGVIITLFGFYFLYSYIIASETLSITIIAGMSLIAPVGIWFALVSFRKRLLLHVHTVKDTRKLVFHKKTGHTEIEAFAEKLGKLCNYKIEIQF